MWEYKKYLEYPVNITKPDLKYRKLLINAIGGYAGELAAAIRYLMQASTMPDTLGRTLLFEIGTEEMAHVEILYAMINQLGGNENSDDYKKLDPENYTNNGKGIYPTDATGNPFTVTYLAATGNVLADLSEDMAAEEKARASYENLMDLTDNPEILAPLSFLRQREIVHFERFKELYNYYKDKKIQK